METVIAQLLGQFEDGKAHPAPAHSEPRARGARGTRGERAAAQDGGFRTGNLDHLSYDVSDYRRTRDFYAGLMGMTIANDNGKDSRELHFGDARGVGVRDRTMMSIHTSQPSATAPARRASITSRSRSTTGTRISVRAELERRGLQGPRIAQGGALDTPNYVSLTVPDPDGLGVQISGIARPGDSAYRQP